VLNQRDKVGAAIFDGELRVGAILLLAAAVARPFLRGQAAPPGPQLAVLLLDNSPSMQTRRGGATRWQMARSWAAETLSALPPGSRVAVISLTRPQGAGSLPEPTAQTDIALRAIDGLGESALRADPAAALDQAIDLASRSELRTRVVYVLSDFQAGDWSPARPPVEPGLNAIRFS